MPRYLPHQSDVIRISIAWQPLKETAPGATSSPLSAEYAQGTYLFVVVFFPCSMVESITLLLPDGYPRRLVSRCMPQTRSQLNRYQRILMASVLGGRAG